MSDSDCAMETSKEEREMGSGYRGVGRGIALLYRVTKEGFPGKGTSQERADGNEGGSLGCI